MCANNQNEPIQPPQPLVDRNGNFVGYDTPMGRRMLVKKEMASTAQPTSDPAAQREAAAAPAEPAAGPETSAPPRAMPKEEAAVRLCGLARGTDDPATLRALLLGCKALAREGIHKRRNRAARSARGKEAAR